MVIAISGTPENLSDTLRGSSGRVPASCKNRSEHLPLGFPFGHYSHMFRSRGIPCDWLSALERGLLFRGPVSKATVLLVPTWPEVL